MYRTFRSFKYICTLLVKFLVLYIVVMVEWSAAEYSLSYTLFLAFLEVCNLHYYREILSNEHCAKQCKQQFLVQKYGDYCNYASNGEASCIAHEYLCRE